MTTTKYIRRDDKDVHTLY